MYTMSLDAITSSAEDITVLPDACAKTCARAVSISKHPPRTNGTPECFNIFEWNVAMWPVPMKPITGGEFVTTVTLVVLFHQRNETTRWLAIFR
jgi:hypothetical protein